MNEALSLVLKHRRGGALLDANLLLVYAVGKYDKNLLAVFHHTKQYTNDFALIEHLLAFFFGTLHYAEHLDGSKQSRRKARAGVLCHSRSHGGNLARGVLQQQGRCQQCCFWQARSNRCRHNQRRSERVFGAHCRLAAVPNPSAPKCRCGQHQSSETA